MRPKLARYILSRPDFPKKLRWKAYERHLKSRWWKDFRAVLLAERPCCERCGAKATDVHHKHYDTVGRERLEDMEALCAPCHAAHHRALRAHTTSSPPGGRQLPADEELAARCG